MLGSERQREILNYIKKNETVSVRQIVKTFYVSEATARRDLSVLEKNGQIMRVFGGATIAIAPDKQVPLFVRERENEKEKTQLCKFASTFIKDGYTIFIDGSSTVQFMIPFLRQFKDLVVITNGMKIASMLSELHIKVFVSGGLLLENSSVLTGQYAEKFIDDFNADLCFISCKGMSDDGKLTDTSFAETQIRKYYIKNSKMKIAIITSNKIGKKYLHTLCNASDLDRVITLNDIPAEKN
ncbi:MAG: DeoR/GlpR transcriptional regulator [Clostridia bacterium]|nr:DeoR/GlpR transcriptional regulator [Clostridia bacterium]